MTDYCHMLASAVQSRLADLGYYRLKVDGVFGVGTAEAVIRFKEAHGLRARDFVGPTTLRVLFSADAKPWAVTAPAVPALPGEAGIPWLVEARRLLGVREVKGAASNPIIMQWARDLDQWYPGDDVPWCGLFVAHCMRVGAPHEPQDFNRLGARNWMGYGVEAETKEPRLGGVAVFWRTHPTKSWNGHVALVTGYSDDAIRVIGGNQDDNVNEMWIERDRLIGIRLPAGRPPMVAPRAQTGKLSTREE